ncbi:helix-turn-helix transcriptional regulator [Pseudomaricurvus alkylphenolicus]|uniref:helix-turn-helix domain-containing protein n=1 Tax=Pseudomaricurvus alkylphenolicus TaxID=1306991 RepID=UPI0014205289|nr:helix-turn-helix transcriptional regulator [Pseudomaricurvus alkylphenolicus]
MYKDGIVPWGKQAKRKPSANRYKLTAEDHQKLAAIHQHLGHSFHQLQSIDALAAFGELNRNKLHYGFKLVYGTTVNDYQVRLRMEWARKQIRLGKLKISDISDRLHYQESSSFSTAYKRYFGEPPSRTV